MNYIIHIINHPPAYEEYSDKPRPDVNWDTPDGLWVGIWGYDWSDLLASEVLKLTGEFKHEVWQPDLRADKIYSYTFENGLIHRLFPAIKKSNGEIISPLMGSFILKDTLLKSKYIFHLAYPHFSDINKGIIDSYKGQKFVLTFHGEIHLPINYILRLQKNLFKKIYYVKNHYEAKKYFHFINHITYQNDKNLNTLTSYYYNGPLTKVTMGVDMNKFHKIDRDECRRRLNIPLDKKVLLTVSRLNSLKQVDKLIDVLKKIEEDFLFIVVGHGTREFEQYLKHKSKKLIAEGKIRFEGYKYADELVYYYNAADLFIHVSKSEGSSVARMEAMACGLPVFCTDTGNTAEVLKENNAGVIVGIKNFKEWREKMTEILNGGLVKPLDINIVEKYYNWANIAEKFNKIYINVI